MSKKKEQTYTNIFYFLHINAIGGVESFYYNLAKKYKDRDITIVYKTGSLEQICRLSKYVRVIRYEVGMHFKCKRVFFNFNIDAIDAIEAEEYYQIAHGDYKSLGMAPPTDPRITKYIGVTKHVANIFAEIRGTEVDLCYNPVCIDKDQEAVLLLVSATRLSKDKGRDRMEKLATEMDRAGIRYLWLVFTDDGLPFYNRNIIRMEPRLDILPYIKKADYLVQLSDAEAFCYSVVEAVTMGTPVIVTDLPVYKELGINKNNSIKLPLDMSEIPLDKIQKGLPEFEYKPKQDKWGTLLGKEKSTYNKELEAMRLIRVVEPYMDVLLNRIVHPGDTMIVGKDRAEYLCKTRGLCKEI